MASPLDFRDVLRRLQQNGWTLDRISGSHHIFVKPGEPLLSIPVKHNRVKCCYGKKINKACGEY